jgi:protoporphyrinogen/coproporphyrinogen III oxidase
VTVRVAVVGGGIAGLVTAWRLVQAHESGDDAHLAVTVLEADDRFGGRIRTERDGGFTIDGGPDALLATKPEGVALARELGLASRLVGTRPWRHRAFIRRDGRMHPLPDGLSGVVPGDAGAWMHAGMLHWSGRLRAAFDLVVPAPADTRDESIASFARRRFGREAWDWLIEPLLAGIHGGDGERLGIASTFPVLRNAERSAGSVIRGLRVRSRDSSRAARVETVRGSPFLAPVNGMQEITDALVERLHARSCELRAGVAVRTIERRAGTWSLVLDNGSRADADCVVLAVPANRAATLVDAVSDRLSGLLSTIPFASSVLVNAAFDRATVRNPLEGHGHLNPRRSGKPVAACTWTSSKFESRAPDDRVLLRGFIKGERADSLDDAGAIRLFREELADALGIEAEPKMTRVFRHTDGMPQYHVDHGGRVDAIEREADRLPGLFLAGNSYHGVGIADTIRSAGTVAGRVHVLAQQLQSSPA